MTNFQRIGLLIGILGFITFNLINIFPNNLQASNLLAIVILMVSFWIFEVIPLSVTALFPFILFPIYGIIKADIVASYYINSTIFLFMGGFLLAYAMEEWMLHKRLSLLIIDKIGVNTDFLILGFMLAATFLSMFISNTATAIMMMPIGLSVIKKIEHTFDEENSKKFSISIMLGIAYSASIGGIATIIGTAPNLSFKRIFEQSFPDLPEITFAKWFIFAFPISIIMMILTWFLLTKLLFRIENNTKLDKKIIKVELQNLGKINYQENVVLLISIFAAFLWIFRVDIVIGNLTIYGWSNLFVSSNFIDDGLVAIFISVLLFIIPSQNIFAKNNRSIKNNNIGKAEKEDNSLEIKSSNFILPTNSLNQIPWDILILLGGGFALAQGFQTTGFSQIIGDSLSNIGDYGVITLVLIICTLLTFLTELTSNTATTNTILPILVGISVSTGINPLILMIPATISASFAFMLPVGTPPNSIVFSTGRINIRDMVKTGLILNILGIIVVTIFILTTGKYIFGY